MWIITLSKKRQWGGQGVAYTSWKHICRVRDINVWYIPRGDLDSSLFGSHVNDSVATSISPAGFCKNTQIIVKKLKKSIKMHIFKIYDTCVDKKTKLT